MVDGIVEEKFSARTGILSRLFAWSPEDDKSEQHIQMAPIDPILWIEFQDMVDQMKKTKKVEKSDESEKSEDSEKSGESVELKSSEKVSNNKDESEYSDEESSEYSYSDEETVTNLHDISNTFNLSPHECGCIESVLECVDKCRLDDLLASSVEWSNNTLLSFITSAIHLYESPYRKCIE